MPAFLTAAQTILNRRYKDKAEVYDSAGKCYVSSRIFKDGAFDTLYCVCGPQVKNTLFFIENGIMPGIYAVPCGRQFHTPYFESAVVLLDVLHNDHSWQGNNSFFGNQSRWERSLQEE